MKYFAVLDTNVIVSALLRWNSLPGQVAAESLTGMIIPLLNEEIVTEYREVLNRPKFHFLPDAVNTFIDGIIKRGIFVDADPITSDILEVTIRNIESQLNDMRFCSGANRYQGLRLFFYFLYYGI